jgi:hypothetical protein
MQKYDGRSLNLDAGAVGPGKAQNGCARLVFLAERQIGTELAKGQKVGEVAKRGQPKNIRDADNLAPAKLPEVGEVAKRRRPKKCSKEEGLIGRYPPAPPPPGRPPLALADGPPPAPRPRP